MKRAILAITEALAAARFSGPVAAQAKEQFVPLNSYWVGPYAPGGTAPAFSNFRESR